jgi:hypothetical protein
MGRGVVKEYRLPSSHQSALPLVWRPPNESASTSHKLRQQPLPHPGDGSAHKSSSANAHCTNEANVQTSESCPRESDRHHLPPDGVPIRPRETRSATKALVECRCTPRGRAAYACVQSTHWQAQTLVSKTTHKKGGGGNRHMNYLNSSLLGIVADRNTYFTFCGSRMMVSSHTTPAEHDS